MAHDPDRVARATVARRRINRAAGLLREARTDLAHASDGADTIAVVHVDAGDQAALEEVVASARLGATRPGGVDVVILARPTPG